MTRWEAETLLSRYEKGNAAKRHLLSTSETERQSDTGDDSDIAGVIQSPLLDDVE